MYFRKYMSILENRQLSLRNHGINHGQPENNNDEISQPEY